MMPAPKGSALHAIEKRSRSIPLGRLAKTKALRSGLIGLSAFIAVWVSLVNAPGIVGVLGACLALVMLAVAYFDWRSLIIPDWLNGAGTALAIVHAMVLEPQALGRTIAVSSMRGLAIALVFFCSDIATQNFVVGTESD
jgi:hypothetical protein